MGIFPHLAPFPERQTIELNFIELERRVEVNVPVHLECAGHFAGSAGAFGVKVKRVGLVAPVVVQQDALLPIDDVVLEEDALVRLDPAAAQLLQPPNAKMLFRTVTSLQ